MGVHGHQTEWFATRRGLGQNGLQVSVWSYSSENGPRSAVAVLSEMILSENNNAVPRRFPLTTITNGSRRNWVAYTLIGLLVSVSAIGWAILMVHTDGNPGISPQIVSWQAADRSVRVHYEIAKSKGDDVHCAIIAYDTQHAEIGRAEVAVPPGTSDVDRRQEVATSSRAIAVDVQECRTG
jgi:hypothetical protein